MFNLKIDNDSKGFWEGTKKGKLMIQRCIKTNNCFLYSRSHFGGSAEDDYIWIEASGKGTVYSYTISHIPGGSEHYVNKVPYVVASIRLIEGVRLTSNIITKDLDKVKIGDKVKVKFIKLNDYITYPCFELIE